MSKGENVNAATTSGASCLYVAAENEKLDIVDHVLKLKSLDINQKRMNGRTPLFIAAINGHISVVKQLVENGSNIDLEVKENEGMTPLLGSCFVGRVEIVKYLVDKGADLFATTNDGTNCLILAAGMENLRKYEAFPQKGSCGNASAIKELLSFEKV